jgi:pSer/pThr/pTyr-binding forkhead associated (FHA) protein
MQEYNLKYRIYSEGRNEEYILWLKEGERYSLGRQGEGLQLFDPSVSRIHCYFLFDGKDFWVIDDGSTNGTYYNDQRIKKQSVHAGDTIKLGVYTIDFVRIPGSDEEIGDIRKAKAPEGSPEVEETSESKRSRKRVSTPMGLPRNQNPNLVDDLDLSPQGILKIYKALAINPFGFFDDVRLSGGVRRPFALILVGSLVVQTLRILTQAKGGLFSFTNSSVALKIWAGTLVSILIATLVTVLVIGLSSYILELLRGFLGADGRFIAYFRFFAYMILVAVVCQLAASLSLGILGILLFGFLFFWTVVGFTKAFDARMLSVGVTFLFLFLLYASLARVTLERFGPFLFAVP